MDTLLCNSDGDVIFFGAPSATDEVLAFHYGDFDNHYGDGTVAAAAANGRVYADTVPATLPTKFGTIGTPSTASGQTTYSWTPPPTSLQANVLVVAGGGGGGGVTGTGASGGGGAGGLVFDIERTITSGAQTIVVGNGGAGGGNARVNGENGKNSTAFGLTANGGGGGGGSSDSAAWNAGSAGGSGGGGGGGDVNPNGAGGASTQPGTNTGVYIDGGFAGGASSSSSGDCGGGGGGAGEKGDDFLGASVGNGYDIQGGDGLLLNVFGETYGQSGWFAGGGGAFARNDNIPRAGGLGGGGAGGSSGVSHTGGGGGGRDGGVLAGNGGSGIVAIRYIVDNNVMTLLPNTGRYVRLQHTVNNAIINLREIEVYDENDVNVALNKPVTGNTPAHGSFPYSNLTDGITNTNANLGHTTGYAITGDNYDYVQIDLGSITTVSRIFIYNRTDNATVRNRAIGIKAILIAANGTTIVKETPTITTSSATYTLTF